MQLGELQGSMNTPLIPNSTEVMTILKPIESAVCEIWGVSPVDLFSKSRPRHIIEPRFAYIGKAFETGRFSESGLARILRCDHGTIANAVRRCKELREIDPQYSALYSRL